MKKYYFIVGLLAIIVFIAGLSFWYSTTQEKNEQNRIVKQKLESSYREAGHAASNLNSSTTIAKYQELIENATDQEIKNLTKIKLGFYYNRIGSLDEGLVLLKDIIKDESLTPQRRAEALIAMINVYYQDRSPETANRIFTALNEDKEFFSDLLNDWNVNDFENNNRVLFKEVYEFSNNIFETSYAHYLIASWYGGKILNNQSLSNTEKAELLSKVKDRVSRGDKLLSQLNEDKPYSQQSFLSFVKILTLHFRVFNLMTIARFDTVVAEKIESEYKNMFKYYDASPSVGMKSIEGYTRFYYAAYLADMYGDSKKEEISSVLQPLTLDSGVWGEANASAIWDFFKVELSRVPNERDHNYKFIMNLASLDDRFKLLTERLK